MFDFGQFDEVFSFDPDYKYDQQSVQQIDSNRRTLEGLFVDRVFKLLGIRRPTKIYPPKSNDDLRALHKAIVETSASDHPKLSLLYYILLDCDATTKKRDHSNDFERKSYLPSKYQIYMKGLWHMDHLEFEAALQYLTHPSLIPTFPDEILETLVRHTPEGDVSLALAYYQTVQPTLTNPQAIESLFTALTRASITDAFYFSRTQSDDSHRHMLETLISHVLNHPDADRGLELVNLPFTIEEEQWFEEYLTTGEGRNLKKAKDTVVLRRIGTGNFTGALTVEGLNSRPVAGLSWDMVQEAIQTGLGKRR